MKSDVDYTDLVIMDTYAILTTHKNPWPSNFTRLRKLELIDKMIEYMTETQRYEECSVLTKIRDGVLLNEFGGSDKTTKKR